MSATLYQPPRHSTPVADIPRFMLNRVQPACTPDRAEDFFRERAGSYPLRIFDLCAVCPVRRECLEWALDNDEKWGVWGAKTPSERDAILRNRRAA